MFPNYIKIIFSFMISNVEKHSRTILENDHIVIAKSVALHSNPCISINQNHKEINFYRIGQCQNSMSNRCPIVPEIS